MKEVKMRRTITIAILVILIMGIIPFTIAEKPAPMAASIIPNFDIDDSDTGDDGDDTGEDSDIVTTTGSTGKNGGGGGGGSIATTETTEQDTEPSEEDDNEKKGSKERSIFSQQVVAVTPVFRVWRVNKFISQDPNATEMLMS